MKYIIPCLALFLLTGCLTDGSALVYGDVRDPITLEEVKIYRDAPDVAYENIAFVRANTEFWGNQQEMVDKAKVEAAPCWPDLATQ